MLAVKLFPYPAWKATRNGAPIEIATDPCVAPLQLPLPAGHSDVILRFTRTPDRTLANAISLAAALILLIFFIAKRRLQ